MTNAVYPTFKSTLVNGNAPNLLTATVRLVLIDSTKTAYAPAHVFLSDLNPIGVYQTSEVITGKTVTPVFGATSGAKFDCDDPVVNAVTGAGPIDGFVGYVDTGDPATSPLIFYQSENVSGTPITPNGGAIMIVIDAAGLFIL